MMQTQAKEKPASTPTSSYDVPIPKPPAELLDAFLSSLQSKLVTRRLPNGRNTRRQNERNRVRGERISHR